VAFESTLAQSYTVHGDEIEASWLHRSADLKWVLACVAENSA